MANVTYRVKVVCVGKTEFAPGMAVFDSVEEMYTFLDTNYPSWTKFTLEVRRS
jgi:hypothetical protein